MEKIGLSHRPKRKPNGITKADCEAQKSDALLKRDFTSTPSHGQAAEVYESLVLQLRH